MLRAQLCTLEVPIVWVPNLAETTSFVKVTRCMDGGPALPLSCQFTVKLATPDRDLRKENRVHHQLSLTFLARWLRILTTSLITSSS